MMAPVPRPPLLPPSPSPSEGAADVTTGADAADESDVPWAFVAVTVNVYAVSALKPLTMTGLVVPVALTDPGSDVTV